MRVEYVYLGGDKRPFEDLATLRRVAFHEVITSWKVVLARCTEEIGGRVEDFRVPLGYIHSYVDGTKWISNSGLDFDLMEPYPDEYVYRVLENGTLMEVEEED